MKRFLLLLLAGCVVLLAGCSTTQYQSDTHTMKIAFPDYMTVFDGTAPLDDALLSQYGLSAEGVQADRENGCIYLAVGTKDGVQRKVAVSVFEDDYSKEIWQLKESDTATVTEFTNDVIAEFNTAGQQLNDLNQAGCQVINQGQKTQGDAFCIYLDIAPYNETAYDSIYLATIYNGKWYSVLYNCNVAITPQLEEEAHDVFDSFYPTEKLAAPGTQPENNSGLQAFLLVIVAAIAVMLIVLVVRLVSHKEKPLPNAQYEKQFEDELELMTTKKSKTKKDKRQ